jgi:hypothetical protein
MRVQKRFLIGLFGLALLAVVGAGSFFGAQSRGDGKPAEANNITSDPGGGAQVSASANASGADPFVNQYAGEFLCGDMATLTTFGIAPPLGPGIYQTEISIHNANSIPAFIQKKVVPLPLVQPEQIGSPRPRRYLTLQADEAFQIDCNDIMSFFPVAAGSCNGGPVPQPTNAFCKGYVVVEGGKQPNPLLPLIVPAPLDMTITITVTDPGGGLTPPTVVSSLDFELQPGRVINYPCWNNSIPCP